MTPTITWPTDKADKVDKDKVDEDKVENSDFQKIFRFSENFQIFGKFSDFQKIFRFWKISRFSENIQIFEKYSFYLEYSLTYLFRELFLNIIFYYGIEN